MSKVKIEGNASGTGTLTIAAPNTNTDRTLTLPDAAGELLTTTGDGSQLTGITSYSPTPAFRAVHSSIQNPSNNTFTKVNFTTEAFDTDSCYDTTNSRFTPNKEGYYWVASQLQLGQSGGTLTQAGSAIYKNGSAYNRGGWIAWESGTPNGSYVITNNNDLVYMNGSTDYLEVYGYINGSGTPQVAASYNHYFTAWFVGDF